MSESSLNTKAALRTAAREKLARLTAEEKDAASRRLCQRLAALPAWEAAHAVLLFAPRPDEPQIWPLVDELLATGRLAALPRYVAASGTYEAAIIANPDRDVAPGRFGILEPNPVCRVADLNRLDLVLVPGLAFDSHGYRLGRGKGFYDRLLAAVSGRTCGVAYDTQLVSTLPVEPHDVPLNCILTPTHWLEF